MERLREKLHAFQFRQAFVDVLGWNATHRAPFEREVFGRTLRCAPIADAGGFTVVEVTDAEPSAHASAITAPGCRAVRQKLDGDLLQDMHAHILVFVNAGRTESVWHLGKTIRNRRLHRERRFYSGGPIQPLLQLLAGFEIPWELMDRDGEVSHAAMLDLVDKTGAFAERVSRRFYDQLKRKRDGFEEFLNWIEDEQQRSWYVTALLNRLMFIYFIQRQGMLGADHGYLKSKLAETEKQGPDRFYRDFLLPLCFFGFGRRKGERGRFEQQFAEVPYLDGGLFELHEVERAHGVTPEPVRDGTLPAAASVPDSEFRAWFDFFDAWRWTLDEDNPANDGEINPGILGYIFEKYVNQKQMGAYYTKEDITGYICRNTILPRLFDMMAETGPKGAKAVQPLPIGPHPNLLNDGKGISQGEGIDRYVYEAVRTTEYLPTETDREFDARQARYQSILDDFEAGKIATVNDFITYNLDIERMARDFVATIQDAEVLRAFYFDCLRRITVLDPTCGSGAFLFAALKILYPLYDACLDRMKALCVCDVPPAGEPLVTMKGEMAFANDVDAQQSMLDPATVTDDALAAFSAELGRIEEHPNREYYILKTIIVNNLYGVDIMDEAVEICKLRLFLKLIAHAKRDDTKENWGIEPLPDVDFNILAGNTLVGYATIPDIDRLWDTCGGLPFEKDHSKLRQLVAEYGHLLNLYRRKQLGLTVKRDVTKADVTRACELVRPELDEDLWRLYRSAGKVGEKTPQRTFLTTHRPFHWFLQFPEVMAAGGFDVLVGNPPYLNLAGFSAYSMLDYATIATNNLYAICLERAFRLAKPNGQVGFVVPVSSVATEGYASLQCLLRTRRLAVSTFDDRPAHLFEGLDKNTLAIILWGAAAHADTTQVTRLQRWNTAERPVLFPRLAYRPAQSCPLPGCLPKLGSEMEVAVWKKLFAQAPPLARSYSTSPGGIVRYSRKVNAFLQVLDFVPEVRNGAGRLRAPSEFKDLRFVSTDTARSVFAALNSSLFRWYLDVVSDGSHLNRRELDHFPFEPTSATLDAEQLGALASRLSDRLIATSVQRTMRYGHDTLTVQCIVPKHAKPIIDEIDRVLAKHYGFTDEELDFIINYDIKYRMGRDDADADDA